MHYYIIILFYIFNELNCLPITRQITTVSSTQSTLTPIHIPTFTINYTTTTKHVSVNRESSSDAIISSCVAVGCIILFVIWVFSIKANRN